MFGTGFAPLRHFSYRFITTSGGSVFDWAKRGVGNTRVRESHSRAFYSWIFSSGKLFTYFIL
jgi:hypothetical protein